MSSSERERGTGRFLAGALTGFAAIWVVLLGAMATTDPLGATQGNSLCPAGAKTEDAGTTRALIAARLRPRTIVLGTSRVRMGFSEPALAQLGPAPVANLGTGGALPAEFAAFAGDALAGGRLERAYIGVDFNVLHQDDAADIAQPIADARFPALERLRRAFLSYDALTALPRALAGCRPALHPNGAPLLRADGRVDEASPEPARERARLLAHFRTTSADDVLFAARMAELRDLVARLRRQRVEVVLFSAPYQENLLSLIAETGHRADFERFHAEVARLAHEQGVPFVDLHGEAAVRELRLPPCPGGGIGCHYSDLTHYVPLVGERIAGRLAAASGQSVS